MTYKTLIGIGNAAIDGTIEISSDAQLQELELIKGTCVFAGNDDPRMKRVFDLYPNYQKDPGGAAANAIYAYSALGGDARFIGKTGVDEHGDFFTKNIREVGVKFDTKPTTETQSTFLFSVITPDRERSFLSNHGASHHISSDDVNEEWFTKDTSLIIDGYMLMSGGGPDALFTAMNYAENNNSEMIFMPCSLTVILEKDEHVQKIMKHAQAIICNEEEALALTKTNNISDLSNYFDWGVVTLGEKGAFYFTKDESNIVPIPKTPSKILNTNGAGDNFSGGLLYGLHHGMDIEEAVKLGQLCAIHVLGQRGARCDKDISYMLDQI